MRVPQPRVTVSLDLPFSADKVWGAWTEADQVKHWFGSDPAGRVSAAELDVRTGGRFEVAFVNSDGSDFTCFGVYSQVDLHRTLAFSWAWRNAPGTNESVTVDFVPIASGCRLTLEHGAIDPQTTHGYAEGWSRTFEKLRRFLTSTRPRGSEPRV